MSLWQRMVLDFTCMITVHNSPVTCVALCNNNDSKSSVGTLVNSYRITLHRTVSTLEDLFTFPYTVLASSHVSLCVPFGSIFIDV